MDRRSFLMGLGALGAGAVGANAAITPKAQTALMQMARTQTAAPIARSREAHAVERLTYGVTPDLYESVRVTGVEAFVDQQLQPDAIDDAALRNRLNAHSLVLDATTQEIVAQYAFQPQVIVRTLGGAWLIRALESPRQLFERTAYFWSNHFYMYARKDPSLYLLPEFEREVIRAHTFTNFRALLGASSGSPGMLVYLDNAQSHRAAPNENFARELLELHTLGVGNFTEDDVKAAARIFTGWSLIFDAEAPDAFTYIFRRAFHDREEKTLLGTTFAPDGEAEGVRALDLLAAHPATARFISRKLARRFVADFPDDALVERMAAIFTASGGDVPTLLRTIFDAPEFWSAPPKLKTPFEYLVSVLRALGGTITDDGRAFRVIGTALDSMGHVPYGWPAPNGYPDVAGAWKDSLLLRWNAAIAVVTAEIPGVSVESDRLVHLLESRGIAIERDAAIEFFADYLYGRPLTETERGAIVGFANTGGIEEQIGAALALMLAAPAFQYR